MNDEPPDSLSWSPAEEEFRLLLQRFTELCPAVYVVGGAVRDALRDTPYSLNTYLPSTYPPEPQKNNTNSQRRKPSDVDLLLPYNACGFSRQVADIEGWAFYKLDAERDIARLVYTQSAPPLVCDVARFQGASLEADLAERDFSINAMAFQLSPDSHSVRLIDLFGGLDDIRKKKIRRIHDRSLLNDPNRLVRAVRLSTQLGYTIENETYLQILENAELVLESSQERIRDELWKGMATSRSAEFIELLRQTKLLRPILPEVADLVDVPQSAPHHLDVYRHTLLAVRHAGFLRDWILRDNEEDSAVDSCPSDAKSCISVENPSAPLLALLGPWRSRLREHFGHELAVGHSVADWLVWFALFHDVGKPCTRTEEYEKRDSQTDGGRLPEDAVTQSSVRYRFFEHEHVGAKLTEHRLTVLHFSGDEIKLATKVVDGHMRPHHLNASFNEAPLSRRACYRFFRDMGQSINGTLNGINVLLVALSDVQSIYPGLGGAQLQPLDTLDFGVDTSDGQMAEIQPLVTPTNDEIAHWQEYLYHIDQLLSYGYDDTGIPAITQPRLVDGRQLMTHLGLTPGPQLGQLLEQIAEAQAAGEIDSVESALEWAAHRLASTLK